MATKHLLDTDHSEKEMHQPNVRLHWFYYKFCWDTFEVSMRMLYSISLLSHTFSWSLQIADAGSHFFSSIWKMQNIWSIVDLLCQNPHWWFPVILPMYGYKPWKNSGQNFVCSWLKWDAYINTTVNFTTHFINSPITDYFHCCGNPSLFQTKLMTFQPQSSGLWHQVLRWQDTIAAKGYVTSLFRIKMGTAWPSEMLVSYCIIITLCWNLKGHDMNLHTWENLNPCIRISNFVDLRT